MSLELLALGLDFMGGLMGNSEAKKQRKLNQQMLQQSQRQFDAQMDQSVQRRVKDAKAAGVHPLFALGASVGASPTISANADAGSANNPMGQALSNMAQTLGIVEQNKASAKKDEAEAALFDSERKRIEQSLSNGSEGLDSVAQKTAGTVKTSPLPDTQPIGPAHYYNPEIPKSKSPGIVAGTVPGTIDVKLPDGRNVNIPNPDLGLDEISQFDYAYQRAVHKGTDLFEAMAPYVGRDGKIARKLKTLTAPWRGVKNQRNKNYWDQQKDRIYPIRRK